MIACLVLLYQTEFVLSSGFHEFFVIFSNFLFGGCVMDSIIFTRIKELCAENNITVNKLESELGMSQYSIGRWKNATSPTVDKLNRIAQYFHVSVDYLIGTTDVRTPTNELVGDQDIVSIQRAREKMTDRDKSRMMTMLKIGFEYAFSDNKTDLSDT